MGDWRERYINKVTCGDCLELMRGLPDKCVDAVITDPPYGVGFDYATHEDKREGYVPWILACLAEMRRIANIVILTPGITHLLEYPVPRWTACYFKPGSTRRNGTGGFNEWEPILFYGDVKLKTDAKRFPDCVNHVNYKIDHPCPKPLNVFLWLASEHTSPTDIILDPFLGSGTTAVAAIRTGRQFIGFEIDPHYCDIANRRIQDELAQTRIPFEPIPEPKQEAMDL